MRLTPRLLGLALWCADRELQGRRDGSRPGGVREWNAELVRALQFQLTLSQSRQSGSTGVQPSKDDHWIGTRDAAAILGWPTRTVQRRAGDLEGRKTSAGWIFPACIVYEHAQDGAS